MGTLIPRGSIETAALSKGLALSIENLNKGKKLIQHFTAKETMHFRNMKLSLLAEVSGEKRERPLPAPDESFDGAADHISGRNQTGFGKTGFRHLGYTQCAHSVYHCPLEISELALSQNGAVKSLHFDGATKSAISNLKDKNIKGITSNQRKVISLG